MTRAKPLNVVFSETNFTTSITALDQSMTLNDVLRVNGLMPRDGTFRYISSSDGIMINHMPAGLAPGTVTVKNPKNIAQIWIDSRPSKGRVFVSSEHQKYCIFGAVKDTHANVFLTNWNTKKARCGYTFSPIEDPYTFGTIVFFRVPLKGDLTHLFNPQSGKEDYPVRLVDQRIESMRGFWSAWELQENLTAATFRADLTPLPANYAPPRPKVKSSAKKKPRPKTSEHCARQIKINSLHPINIEPMIHSCVIPKNNSNRKVHAIACGMDAASTNSNVGYVAAWGNNSRPTMINGPVYQYGMSHFVKIPEEGRLVPVYNPVNNAHLQCRLTDSPDLRVEDLRGRWVIAQLRRHERHKRILKLHSLPSDYNN